MSVEEFTRRSSGAMSSGLTNDDFRKIMATPRRVDVEETPRRTPASGFAKPAVPKAPKSRPVKASKPESLLPPGYRDRAQERRERDQAMIEEVPIENEQITAEDIEALPDHMSKYLGGDENRTHLVKGLDYLLLQKSREDIQKDEERRLEQAMADAAAAAAAAASTTASQEAEPQHLLSFKTAMARNIYNKCVEEVGSRSSHSHQTTSFQPGRTVYEFETDTFGSAAMPTILHRSEEDCGPIIHQVPTKLPGDTWSRLEEAMTYIRSGVRPRNLQPIPAVSIVAPAKPPPVTFDDDDDIFADAGDYVCEPRDPTAAAISTDRVVFAPESGAAETDLELKVSMREAIVQARSTAGQLGVFEKNIEREEPESVESDQNADQTPEAKTARLMPVMDEYDEYTAGAQIGYDSDEDVTTADNRPGQMSATKMSRAKSREKQKLSTQWQQISSMIEKKKDAKRRPENKDQSGLNKKSKSDY